MVVKAIANLQITRLIDTPPILFYVLLHPDFTI
jgi:hypothetical protein